MIDLDEKAKEQFVRILTNDNPGILPDEAERIYNMVSPYWLQLCKAQTIAFFENQH